MSLEGFGKYLYIFVEWVMAFLTSRSGSSTISSIKRMECLLELVVRHYWWEPLMLKNRFSSPDGCSKYVCPFLHDYSKTSPRSPSKQIAGWLYNLFYEVLACDANSLLCTSTSPACENLSAGKQGARCNGSNGAENDHSDPDVLTLFTWWHICMCNEDTCISHIVYPLKKLAIPSNENGCQLIAWSTH